jgi:hypothetical protein
MYGGYYPPTYPLALLMWTLLALIFWWTAWRLACHFSPNKLIAWFWFIGFAGIAGMRVDQNFDVRLVGWTLLLLFLHFFGEDRPMHFTQRQTSGPNCTNESNVGTGPRPNLDPTPPTVPPLPGERVGVRGNLLSRILHYLSSSEALLVVPSGMLALTKFTALVGLTAVVIAIAADTVFRARRFPWIVPLFAASILFFWLAAGQSLSLLWPYLRYSWLLTGAYSEAMVWTAPGETGVLAALLLATAALLAMIAYAAWLRRRFFGIFAVLGLGAIVFLNFKHVCVRYDQVHEITAALDLLLVTLACLAVTGPVWRKRRWWLWVGHALALAGIGWFCSAMFNRCFREVHLPEERLDVNFARTLNPKSILGPAILFREPSRLQKIYEKNLAEVRRRFPLPPISGAVDAYPWNEAVLIAHDLQFDPRPVIQSYSAFTPELAELNAAHLRGSHAPDNILFDINSVNNNFPSLEDGRSCPELLTRYDITDLTGQFVILKRSSHPRKHRLTPLADVPVQLGVPVTIAINDAPLWAELEISPTLFGAVVATLYKPPVLNLSVSLEDGRQLLFRVVPGMARSGFLLSPLIPDNESFASLYSPAYWHNLRGLHIKSLTLFAVTASGSTPCYRSPLRLRLYRLDIPAAGGPEKPISALSASSISPAM